MRSSSFLSRRRSMWAIALVGALLGIALWMLGRGWLHEVTPDRAIGTVAPADAGESDVDDPSGVSATRGREPEAAAPPIGKPHNYVCQGTIKFVDVDDNRVPSARGYITWKVESREGSHEEVMSAIDHDAWRLDAAGGSKVQLVGAMWSSESNTQNADVAPFEVPIEQLHGTEILAVLRLGPKLNVVDATTRQHLKDLQVIHVTPMHEEFLDLRVPPRRFIQTQVETCESPISLADRPGTGTGWVRAPGYAWARFAYRGAGGEITIALSACSTVEIEVLHAADRSRRQFVLGFPMLDSGEPSNVPVFEREVTSEATARIEGVPTGRMRVVVCGGPRVRGAGPYLGREDVEFVPQQTHLIAFDLGVPGVRRGLAELQIVLSRELGDGLSSMARLIVEPLDLCRDIPLEMFLSSKWTERSKSFTAKFTDILPGRYRVTLMPGGLGAEVALTEGATESVNLQGDRSALVTVVVKRPGINERFSSADLRYRPASVRSSRVWTDVGPDISAGSYSFRCAPGGVSILCAFSGHRTVTQDFVVSSGSNDFVIELEREVRRAFTVRSVQGETQIPLPPEFWLSARVESLDAPPGKQTGITVGTLQVGNLTAGDAPWASYAVDQPGRYQLVFPEWSGIVDVQPLVIDVPTVGEVSDVVAIYFD